MIISQRDVNDGVVACRRHLRQALGGPAGDLHHRLPCRQVLHSHILPCDPHPQASAEGLRTRLLRGPTFGIGTGGIHPAFGFTLFGFGEHPVAKQGAKPIQRYRFGVIPQITPVLLSQILYYLESNTRSATIIGAITGGGIGLMLTQAIITQKDWEEVTYYIVLVVLMVMMMDTISGWLRSKLIGSSEDKH